MYIESLMGLLALVLSTLSAVATLYLALQLSSIRRLYLRESRANQMQRTIEAVRLPSSVDKTIGEVLHHHFRGDKDAFDDPRIVVDITSALTSLEILATGILSEVYDEEIAYSQLGYSLTAFYEAVQRFIYQSRERYASASQYVQLERLARRWRDRERFSGIQKLGAI